MDKKVIFAVAGSGKTTYIVNQLDLDKRSLIITYTTNNYNNLRNKIIGKFGYFPSNIRLMGYFSFLYSFCCRPFLSSALKSKGINFENPPIFPPSLTDPRHFMSGRRLYSNRISKLLEISNVTDHVNSRLEKYFDNFFIDEVQDIAGHDFNFLKQYSKARISMLFVGDFYQHTYDTSRDGQVNKNLHKDYEKYKKEFKRLGFEVDTTTLKNSHRCSASLCTFVRENLGIDFSSNRTDQTLVRFVDNEAEVDRIFYDSSIVKLFYKERHKFGCYSKNWGESKGDDRFNSIAVVLNKTTLSSYKKGLLLELSPQTKNKLYVACSRARQDLFFIPEVLLKKFCN